MTRVNGAVDHKKTAALLKAAEAVIARDGARASLSQVARAAGVSKQTLYNRFGGRRALFAALAADRATNCPPPVVDQLVRQTPADALQEYTYELLAYFDQPVHRELLAPRTTETEAAGAEWRKEVLGGARRELSRWLAERAASGQLRISDPEAMAALLIQLSVAQTLAPVGVPGELNRLLSLLWR